MSGPRLEALSKIDPRKLTLDRVAKFYQNAIALARRTVESCDFHTQEGNFAATHAVASACVLRRLISSPLLFSAPIYQSTGGPENNPHRVIDEIGCALFTSLQQSNPLPAGKVFIEENHQWLDFVGTEAPGTSVAVNIDTLDGTSNILTGHRDQASGIMVTDLARNRFLGGAIVSLVDNAFITAEPGHCQLYQLANGYRSASPLEQSRKQPDRMRLATLGRHLQAIVPFPFTHGPYTPDLSTFGGYGLYRVLTGSITTMFDARGQIWYEAALWGPLAEALGLVVTDFQNRHYDWFQILRDSQQPGYNERMPLVISHDLQWHYQFLDAFEKWQKANSDRQLQN